MSDLDDNDDERNKLQPIFDKTALTKSKAVTQYNNKFNIIKEWSSSSDASKSLNITRSVIYRNCASNDNIIDINKLKITRDGYIWKYKDDPDLDNEIWIEMKGCLCGLFISNIGRYYTEHTMKSFGYSTNTYMAVGYKHKNHSMARMVLTAFISDPPTNKHVAHHINGEANDNKLENLKWELMGNCNKHTDESKQKHSNSISKKIIQLKDGIEIEQFDSVTQASEKTGIKGCNISMAATGKRKSSGGFGWKYKDEQDLTDEEWREYGTANVTSRSKGMDEMQFSNMGRCKSMFGKTYGSYHSTNKRYYFHNKLMHILIAETFLENPGNKKTVDHIDGDSTNNKIINLRWATSKEQYLNR
jgi:hypothetical protein